MKLFLLAALLAAPAFSTPVSKETVCKQYGEAAIYASGLIYQMNLEKMMPLLKQAFPLVPDGHMEGIVRFVLTPPIVPGSESAKYLVQKCLELRTVDERNEENHHGEIRR